MNRNLGGYRGEWVAIHNDKVFAHGKKGEEVINIAKKKYPKETPFITFVPPEGSIFY